MPTESEIKLNRYNQIEREADEMGRLLGVRRLKPSEHIKVIGLTPELTGFDEIERSDGEKVRISHRMPMLLASSVCEVNNSPIPFPRTRAELDAIYDRLDTEGLAAAGKAWVRLVNDEVEDPVAEAKNL